MPATPAWPPSSLPRLFVPEPLIGDSELGLEGPPAHYLGTVLDHGGWGREPVERLFRPGLRYLPAEVHERLDLSGQRVANTGVRIEHDTARSDAEYAAKLDRYAALWAQQRQAAGKRAGPLAAPLHAAAHWLKNYLLRGGFLDRGSAARYHFLHARYVYRKYALLRGAGHRRGGG